MTGRGERLDAPEVPAVRVPDREQRALAAGLVARLEVLLLEAVEVVPEHEDVATLVDRHPRRRALRARLRHAPRLAEAMTAARDRKPDRAALLESERGV